MTNPPLFSAEIELFDDPDEGLRVACSANHVPPLAKALADAGFKVEQPRVVTHGTARIPDWVEFPVHGGTFDEARATVLSCLRAAAVSVSEETFSIADAKHVRLDLNNVSLFR